MTTFKNTGWLLILSALLLLIPYTALGILFDYPQILRRDPGEILTRFHSGGNTLILVWWCFALVGLPLLPAWINLGKMLENRLGYIRWATTIGLIGLVVQLIGLLRWTFVVPVLARAYIAGDNMQKAANVAGFQLIHQFGGVLLGEHIGQLFSIIWTVAMATAFLKLRLLPVWTSVLAYIASGIYLMAQLELFATVMPEVPVLGPAGFLGSTLWLIWLIVIGVYFVKSKLTHIKQNHPQAQKSGQRPR